MANIITGRKASIGPVWFTWNTEPAHPHWNTATRMPKAAPIDSRFMIAAVRGMTRLRNTMARRQNESSTTRPMKSGSFEVRTFAKSAKIAVVPPTYTVTPVPAVTSGMVVCRISLIRLLVADDWGDVVG